MDTGEKKQQVRPAGILQSLGTVAGKLQPTDRGKSLDKDFTPNAAIPFIPQGFIVVHMQLPFYTLSP